MASLIDLTGRRFGRLTVIARAASRDKNLRWHCRCDCGKETVVVGVSLRGGATKSCGCKRIESSRERALRRHACSSRYEITQAFASVFGGDEQKPPKPVRDTPLPVSDESVAMLAAAFGLRPPASIPSGRVHKILLDD